MGSLTSRLGLYKADEDEYATVDRDLNDNYDKLDALAAGPTVCTSGTRPVAPYIGQQVYETDTNRLLIFTDDNKWTVILPGAARRSERQSDMVVPNTYDSANVLTGGITTVGSLVCDGVAAFQFSFSWGGITANNAVATSDGMVIAIQRSAVANGAALQTVMSSYQSQGIGTTFAGDGGTLIAEIVPPAGTWNFHARAWRNGGNKTFTIQAAAAYPSRLAIQEIAGSKYS